MFTPILGFIHSPAIKAFTLGQPAFPQVAILAESGNTEPAKEALAALPDLVSGTHDTGAPLLPGESVILEFEAADGMTNISVLAMLIPTNDAFFALNGATLPAKGTDTYFSVAYDAGSELNDESCLHIPGPASVCTGEGVSTAGGEGFVHIYPGIHGIGDLATAKYDWRNPVAQIEITRIFGD